MTGIYIHIPFCKKVCYYCDFHFTVSLKQKDAVLECILKEIEQRKDYFHPEKQLLPEKETYREQKDTIDTIYLGGGTPTVLSCTEIGRILDKIRALFSVSSEAEITVEANPDDLNSSYLKELNTIGVTRLSIGIQSFFDEDLKWMNRRHNGSEAERAVKLSQDAGFGNMNIDLIYGLPQLSEERWSQNLEKFFSLDIPHLSAYHLTIEPKTVFGYYKRKGKLTEIDEEKSFLHYTTLICKTRERGYQHYEISNFCKEGAYSRHNTNYWKQGQYLGIGPAAHSYNGVSRQWNARINEYLTAFENKTPHFEIEYLTEKEQFNDFLLTGLRTSWGIDISEIRQKFGKRFSDHLEKELDKIMLPVHIEKAEGRIRLTEKGMFVSDKIISDLFYV